MEVLHIPPTGKLAYHWPRVDLDPLLCVKIMDDKNNQWSGGIRVDRVDSFHINMRDGDGQCMFLRADVVLQGATYFVVFTDADSMPPPYRLDNLAHVCANIFCLHCLSVQLFICPSDTNTPLCIAITYTSHRLAKTKLELKLFKPFHYA